MFPDQTPPLQPEAAKPAETGNASNPSPREEAASAPNQLLDSHAEKYLREVASIEDLPDAEDQQEMDDTIAREKAGGTE